MECRKRGNPGGSQGKPNAAYVSTPKSTSNSGGSAPAGKVDRASTPPRVGPRKGHSIR